MPRLDAVMSLLLGASGVPSISDDFCLFLLASDLRLGGLGGPLSLLLFPTRKSCLSLPGPSSLWGPQMSVHSALCPADPSLFPMLWAKRCWFLEVHPSRAPEGAQGRWQGQAAS